MLTGAMAAGVAQPIAAMHCHVIFLQGTPPGIAPLVMSMQFMPAIDDCIDVPARTVPIAIAVDWPKRPKAAIVSRKRRRRRITVTSA